MLSQADLLNLWKAVKYILNVHDLEYTLLFKFGVGKIF